MLVSPPATSSLREQRISLWTDRAKPLLLLLVAVVGTTLISVTDRYNNDGGGYDEEELRLLQEEEEYESEPVYAVLFPFFIVVLGSLIYWILSRYVPALPYTALMFIIGTSIGAATVRLENSNILNSSVTDYWIKINEEVLFLIFLPGLIFCDSFGLDVHLFERAFWQILDFAFPMVLAGTCLTALVAWGIFPYDWSWNLAMTFGSILSATDPVAVSALLDSVGAPPRLKVHISGESLMNDGSAMVFYTIFSGLYLLELEIDGVGEDIDLRGGFALFFRMAFGGAAIGLFFGLGSLIVMSLLNRRLTEEENVVEVASIFAMAYLCYFTADPVWGTSGVIATLSMGLTIKAFGTSLINDSKLFEDFWSIIEHLLNTVLFGLGGLVWGSIISNADADFPEKHFTSKDWGYLFLLYVFLQLIRFFLLFSFYPVTNCMGLKTCWQEAVFSAYGGLRGAVGITLALALNTIVVNATEGTNSKFEVQTNKVFGFIGGTAFLTLCINATFAGPILKKLGLADSTETRKQIVEGMYKSLREKLIDKMVSLLAQGRFKHVNFAVIRAHMPRLADLTPEELIEAGRRYHKSNNFKASYVSPKLNNMLAYLKKGDEEDNNVVEINSMLRSLEIRQSEEEQEKLQAKEVDKSATETEVDATKANELRGLFLQAVRARYEKQVADGELVNREFNYHILGESLDFANDALGKGEKLCDWNFVQKLKYSLSQKANKFVTTKTKHLPCSHPAPTLEYWSLRDEAELCISFIDAHTKAREAFRKDFPHDSDLLKIAEQTALKESEEECQEAQSVLDGYEKDVLASIYSHKFCSILLITGVHLIEKMVGTSLLKEKEANEMLDHIQEMMASVDKCSETAHEGELPLSESVAAEQPDEGGKDAGEMLDDIQQMRELPQTASVEEQPDKGEKDADAAAKSSLVVGEKLSM